MFRVGLFSAPLIAATLLLAGRSAEVKPTDNELEALAIKAVATDRDQIADECYTSVPHFVVDSAAVSQRGVHNTREKYWMNRLRTWGTYRCASVEDTTLHSFSAEVDIRAHQDVEGHWVSYNPQFVASGR